MKYQQKSFTVPASSEKSPTDCRHGWIDAKGDCVLCGRKKVMRTAARRHWIARHEPEQKP